MELQIGNSRMIQGENSSLYDSYSFPVSLELFQNKK